MTDYMAEMGAPKEMLDLTLQTDLASVDSRRPCPAAAVGTGEQRGVPPKPSIKFRPTVTQVQTIDPGGFRQAPGGASDSAPTQDRENDAARTGCRAVLNCDLAPVSPYPQKPRGRG